MFLSSLKSENKLLFLKLCMHLASSDGVIAESEKELMLAYCREMDIKEEIVICVDSVDELAKQLAETANDAEKKIVMLELLALANSDGKYELSEQEEIHVISNILGLDKADLEKTASLLMKYELICEEIKQFICD